MHKECLIKSIPIHDFKKQQQNFSSNLGIEKNFLNLIKNISKTAKANILLNGEILKDIHKIGNEIRMSPSSLLFNIVLVVLASAKREGEKRKV